MMGRVIAKLSLGPMGNPTAVEQVVVVVGGVAEHQFVNGEWSQENEW